MHSRPAGQRIRDQLQDQGDQVINRLPGLTKPAGVVRIDRDDAADLAAVGSQRVGEDYS